MKINYRRIIKVLSSCFAICMVLFATLAMPAMAAAQDYALSDFPLTTVNKDGIITFKYSADDIEPYVAISNEDGQTYTSGLGRYWWIDTDWLDVGDVDEDKVTFAVSFLGSTASKATKVGLLDVSDIKQYSTLEYTYYVDVDTGIAEANEWVKFRCFLAVYYFDANKNYISTYTTPTSEYKVDAAGEQNHILNKALLTLPENAKYIAPKLTIAISSANFNADTELYIDVKGSDLSFSVDSVVENSLTMLKIKEKLADMSNILGSIDKTILENQGKLDEIITGNDEMANQAQTNADDLNEAQKDLMDSVNDFDAATDLDTLLPNRSGAAFDISGMITREGMTDAWDALLSRFRPILSHGYFPEILLMVVACINISVLLIGR